MNSGKNAFPASIVEMPRKRSSFTSLERLVHPLDAALRLRRVRADDVDVELGQGAAKLRDALGPTRRAIVVDPEDAVLVAVEGHRLAVALEVRVGRGEVVERRFALHEAQLHQATGRVVDVHQERAARSPVLEPGVLAPIDLHELTKALAAVPRLMRRQRLLAPRNPGAGADEPRPQRLPSAPRNPGAGADEPRPQRL